MSSATSGVFGTWVGTTCAIIIVSQILLWLSFTGCGMMGAGIYGTYVAIDRSANPVRDTQCSTDFNANGEVLMIKSLSESDDFIVKIAVYVDDNLITNSSKHTLTNEELKLYGIIEAYNNDTMITMYACCSCRCVIRGGGRRYTLCEEFYLEKQHQGYDKSGYGFLAFVLIVVVLLLCVPTCVFGIIGGTITLITIIILVIILILLVVIILNLIIILPIFMIISIFWAIGSFITKNSNVKLSTENAPTDLYSTTTSSSTTSSSSSFDYHLV